MRIPEWIRILVVPLLTGIGTGVVLILIRTFTVDAGPLLQYQRVVAAHFPDDNSPIDIFSVRLENVGSKEIQGIRVRLALTSGVIDKFNWQKSTDLIEAKTTAESGNSKMIEIARLNPGYWMTFNILTHNDRGGSLQFEAAGAGMDATERQAQTNSESSPRWRYTSALLSLFAAFGSLLIVFWMQFSNRIERSFGSLRAVTERAATQESEQAIEEHILAFIRQNSLVLVHNPGMGSRKPIGFEADGTISKGVNQYEFRWRIHEGLLEILDAQGAPHNRFFFDAHAGILKSTNDPDVGAIKRHNVLDQKITTDSK